MDIIKYNRSLKEKWDVFVDSCKNGTFLFLRDYMDYHADRFQDFSLLFFEDQRLLAVLPASKHDDTIISHGGLTFGGLLYDEKLSMVEVMRIFEELIAYLKSNKMKRFVYKAIPYIYHKFPSQEDLYALFRYGAKLFRRDISSTIYLSKETKLSKSKRQGFMRAKKENLIVKNTEDFEVFMEILNEILAEKYHTKATHTAEEIKLLHSRFPENIKLFGAYDAQDTMLAGVVVYEHETMVHTQYMAGSDLGRKLGALDLVVVSIIDHYKGKTQYFDFGISTENNGLFLNTGLLRQKEMFGARGVVYDFYEVIL
ncbi:GNAT family N-acetyltransferase [Anoxybacillus sp. TBDG-1]